MTLLEDVRRRSGRRSAARTVGGALLAVLLVAAALSVIGPDRVLRTVASADRATVARVGGLLFVAVLLRGLVLWTTLRAVGSPVGIGRGLVTYLVVTFVNTVVPGGGAGGAPLAGLVIARSARTDYEVGVTATLTVTTLANLMVGAFGVLGVLSLLLTGAPGGLSVLGGLGVALFLLVVLLAVGLWRVRDRVGDAVVSAIATGFAALDRRLPWSLPDRAAVEAHAGTFSRAVEQIVAGSRTQSAALLGFAAAAHVLSVLALFFAFAALELSVSVGLLFVVVPTAVLAAVTPAPGAGGGVEFALVGLLSATTGHPVAAIGAAVLIYRGTGYILRVVLGGVALVALALLG